METKAFQNLLESIVNLNEDHMKGKTVIVNGKRGVVGKEVSKDGETENDEVYRVKFEDGSTKDIPARDMEIAGNTKNKKQPSENEAEDITNEDLRHQAQLDLLKKKGFDGTRLGDELKKKIAPKKKMVSRGPDDDTVE